ncbi:D-Ala-D-Ala carboxypeptidase [Thalassospira xiamenensis]|uniref:D-Ala-D-Ala carboxypeptidase n=1 Tax=Thalassospira xiamenensis TaxID=220697 RepID=A0A367XIK5_9PROT|nr:D-alanyl-D-alanine carboxypeptidase [Thalassospira xiamenensis]RCK53484.1 D-Ala-D-Ala carboxypeptidase [Thalassospira xiamenensis]
MLAPNLTFCGDKIVIAGLWRLWMPVFLMLIAVLSASQVAYAAEKTEPGDPLVKFLRQYVEQAGLPGAVIGIGYGDGQMRFAATGYAAVNPDKGMTRERQFYIGSLTKMMTAVVVLQLASEKRIDLADPIAKWLPEEFRDKIANARIATIRDLLRNSSGIPDYLDGEFFFELVGRDPQHGWRNRELLPLIAGREAHFKPGTQYNPSNSNYILLGVLIEQVEGDHIEAVFNRRIFEPAEMRNTSFGRYPRPDDLARGFDDANGDGKLEDVTDFDVGDQLADGGVISTAEDLLKFGRALFADGILLGPNALERATTDTLFAGEGSYGYGMMIGNTDWGPVWGHDGIYFGYSAEFSWFPKQGVTIVFLSNGRALNEVPPVTGLLLSGLFGKAQ